MSETQTPVSEDFLRDFLDLQRKVADISNAAVGSKFVTGDLIPSMAATRSDALLCDGTAYARTLYPALSAVCVAAGLVGDGSTTFTVPDYRGNTIAGAGAGGFTLATATGAATVTLTGAQSGQPAGTTSAGSSHTHAGGSGTTGAGSAHSHGPAAGVNFWNGIAAGGTAIALAAGTNVSVNATTANESAHTHSFTTPTSGAEAAHTHTIAAASAAAAHTNVQPTLPANVFIKT